MVRSPEETWSALSSFRPVLEQVEARGVPTTSTYGSPVYLGQYLNLHAAIDAEVERLAAAGVAMPLVVDWGAGVGHCAFVRQQFGDRVVAHSLRDPDAAPYSSVLENVCDVAGIELRATDDPVNLPFGDGEVDILVSCGVLEHVHEGGGSVEDSLREIARVLSPGGAFVCGHLPRTRSWIEWFNRTTGRSHHDRRFSRKEVEVIHQGSGLVPVGRIGRYGVVPRIQVARKLEKAGRDTVRAGQRFERFDVVASKVAYPISQNYFFVLRKPA